MTKEQFDYDDDYANNSNDYEPINNRNSKRKIQRYQFGIGKRLYMQPYREKVANFEEFMKRRYSFGLGKRSV